MVSISFCQSQLGEVNVKLIKRGLKHPRLPLTGVKPSQVVLQRRRQGAEVISASG